MQNAQTCLFGGWIDSFGLIFPEKAIRYEGNSFVFRKFVAIIHRVLISSIARDRFEIFEVS